MKAIAAGVLSLLAVCAVAGALAGAAADSKAQPYAIEKTDRLPDKMATVSFEKGRHGSLAISIDSGITEDCAKDLPRYLKNFKKAGVLVEYDPKAGIAGQEEALKEIAEMTRKGGYLLYVRNPASPVKKEYFHYIFQPAAKGN